jgi:hypothetical protein
MTEHQGSFSWIEKEAKKDHMKPSERGGEVIGMVVIGLVALFFYTHQTQSTGFFTSSFGPTEAFLFCGSILVGMTGPVVRLATGRRNAARPPEMLASIFWIASSAWLLTVFPFNFVHLGDVLPADFLHILVSWITNDIARALFVIGILGGIASIAINAILYARVRNLLRTEQLR